MILTLILYSTEYNQKHLSDICDRSNGYEKLNAENQGTNTRGESLLTGGIPIKVKYIYKIWFTKSEHKKPFLYTSVWYFFELKLQCERVSDILR